MLRAVSIYDALIPDRVPVAESFALQIAITKTNAAQQIVYGWASVATVNQQPVVDREGDIISVADLGIAVHEFMAKRIGKALHSGAQVGEIVDSIVFDAAVQHALGIDLGREGWFVGMHVSDPATWAQVEKGELKAFSIGGKAERHALDGNPVVTKGLAITDFWVSVDRAVATGPIAKDGPGAIQHAGLASAEADRLSQVASAPHPSSLMMAHAHLNAHAAHRYADKAHAALIPMFEAAPGNIARSIVRSAHHAAAATRHASILQRHLLGA